MNLHFVGRLVRESGTLMGYLVYSTNTNSIRIFNKNELIKAATEMNISNVTVRDGKLEFYNGALDRYPSYVKDKVSSSTGVLITKTNTKALVILNKVLINEEHLGYDIFYDYRRMRIGINQLYSILNNVNIANGKFVDTEKVRYVAPISGEYSELSIFDDSKVDMGINASMPSQNKFIMFMESKGCRVVEDLENKVVKIGVPKSGLKLEYLKFTNYGTREINFVGGNVAIKHCTVVNGGIKVTAEQPITILNMHLISENEYNEGVHYFGIQANIDKIYIHKGNRTIKNIKVKGTVGEIIAEDTLREINSCFDAMPVIPVLDFTRVDSPLSVKYSFNCYNTPISDCQLLVGKLSTVTSSFKGYRVDFKGILVTHLIHFDGFDDWKNIRELDLREYYGLRIVGGFEHANLSSVKLPKVKEMYITDGFARESNLDSVYIEVTEKECYIGSNAFKNTNHVYVKGKLTLKIIKMTGKTPIYHIVPEEGKIGKFPNIDSERLNDVVIQFEEGIEIIRPYVDVKDKYDIGEIILPSTLKELSRTAFVNGGIGKINLEVTQLEKIGKGMFNSTTFKQGFLICPKTVREIGDEAFNHSSIEKIYLPDTVEKIGKNIFSGKVILLHKGSYADKRLNGAYAKVYVNSQEEAIEMLTASRNSEREIAKIKLAMSAGTIPNWMKNEAFALNAKMIMDIERKMTSDSVGTDRVKLDTSKFIDFDLEKLSSLGKLIKQRIDNQSIQPCYMELQELTDRFKVMSNVITANTKFYAGAFTSYLLTKHDKAIEEGSSLIRTLYSNNLGMKRELNPIVIYKDNKSSIVVVPIKPFDIHNVMSAEQLFYGVMILIDNKVKYVTVAEYGDVIGNFKMAENREGRINNLEELLEEGDNLVENTFKLAPIPPDYYTKLYYYFNKNLVNIGDELISLNTGDRYSVVSKKNSEEHKVISNITKANEHKFIYKKQVFNQELAIRYFDKLNGIEIGEIRGFQPRKYYLCELADAWNNGKMSERDIERQLFDNNTVSAKISAKKLFEGSFERRGYYRTSLSLDMISNKFPTRMSNLCYAFSKYEVRRYSPGERLNVQVSQYDIPEIVSNIKEYTTDATSGSMTLFKKISTYKNNDIIKDAYASENVMLIVGKEDGYGYLTIRSASVGVTVVGIVRDIDEFWTYFNTNPNAVSHLNRVVRLFEDKITLPFEEAWLARQGKIKTGLYPEYEVGTGEVLRMIGL